MTKIYPFVCQQRLIASTQHFMEMQPKVIKVGTVKDGDNKLNELRGGFVRHGLRHRSHLSIWSRQKSKRCFYPISLCQATRHCLKQWNKTISCYQISIILD